MKITSAQFILGAANWSNLPNDRKPEVAFLGRSNVGKSSLINLLVGRKALARTSNTPGKTRELNYYLVNEKLYFVDLPGLGYAKVGKKERLHWSQMIERYIEERDQLRILFHLVDSRHDPMAYDKIVMEAMRGLDVSYVIALTKSDKLSVSKQAQSRKRTIETLAGYGLEAPVILTSSAKKKGREEMLRWIGDVAGV